eukprot:3945791-Prymnesium_polylepis.1
MSLLSLLCRCLAWQSDSRRRDGRRAVCSRLTAECRSRPTSKRVLLSVAPYDADRLSSVTVWSGT